MWIPDSRDPGTSFKIVRKPLSFYIVKLKVKGTQVNTIWRLVSDTRSIFFSLIETFSI